MPKPKLCGPPKRSTFCSAVSKENRWLSKQIHEHCKRLWVFGIVIVTALVMGIWPKPILDRSEKSVQAFLSSYTERLRDARANREAPAHLFPPAPPAPAPAPAPAPPPGGQP